MDCSMFITAAQLLKAIRPYWQQAQKNQGQKEKRDERKEDERKKIGVQGQQRTRVNSSAFSSWISMKIDKGLFSNAPTACFRQVVS